MAPTPPHRAARIMMMDKQMECLETKCTARGDDYCEFEVITPQELEKRKLGEK